MKWTIHKKIENADELKEFLGDVAVKTEPNKTIVVYKPRKWYDSYIEKRIDEKLRSMYENTRIDIKISRSFNGFILQNIERVINKNGFYVKQTGNKVWIGYDSSKTKNKLSYDEAIKRVFIKGIRADLIPTMFED